MLKITAPARVHAGLISVHDNGYQKFGGVGFSISEPNVSVYAKKEKSGVKIIDTRSSALFSNEIETLEVKIKKILYLYKIDIGVSFIISGDLSPHMGLGSGTALTLALIEASLLIFEIEYNNATIIELSGRGRTSGIGVETYFKGGAVLDVGQPFDQSKWQPSSIQKNKNPSKIISTCKMPSWDVSLILSEKKSSLSGCEELSFFSNSLPLNDIDSYYACYHLIFGLYGSIINNDLYGAIKSLRYIKDSTWKKKEVALHAHIEEYLKAASEISFYPCLSSMGPTLFSFECTNKIPSPGFDHSILKVKTNNTGRVVSHA